MRNPIRIALIASVILIPLSSFGQMDCFEKTLNVSRVEGQVFDLQGNTVSGSSITLTLLHDNKPVVTAIADNTGRFHLDASSGVYWLTATNNGFAPASVPVRVRHGLLRLLPVKNIYLILGLGSPMPCPDGTLSKKEFQSTIKSFNDRMKAHTAQK
jgi:hypothetical protein